MNEEPVESETCQAPSLVRWPTRSLLPSPSKSPARTLSQVAAEAQLPHWVLEKAVPLLVSTRQLPLAALRTAMSLLPSPLKSPTVGNWNDASVAHGVGVPVPEAGVSETHHAPAFVWEATSLRPSPLKSPTTAVAQGVPAGRVASGVVANDVPVERLITNSLSPAWPMMALGSGAIGGATVTLNGSSTNRVGSKTEVARTVTIAVPMAPGV